MMRSSLAACLMAAAVLTGATRAGSAKQQPTGRRHPVEVPFRGGRERVQPTGRMSVARAAHTATLLSDGRVLITGGLGGPASTELYDPFAMSFSPGPPLLDARGGSHTATLLPDGRVLIAGGWQNGRPLATTELYDPLTNTFSPGPPMGTVRAEHTATLLQSGLVLIAAGVPVDYSRPFLQTAELYDPAIGAFRPTGSLRTARRAHIATLLADGRVLITGGSSARGNVLSSAEIFDPVTESMLSAGSMNLVRYKHAAAPLPDGRALIIGGSDARDDAGRYDSTEIFDPSRSLFLPDAGMTQGRYKLQDAVTPLPTGEILVGGGAERVEIYSPAAGDFRVVEGDLGDGRLFMTATVLRSGAVLLVGGYGYRSNLTSQAWLYLPRGQ